MYIHEAETDNNVDVVVAPIVIISLTYGCAVQPVQYFNMSIAGL